MISELHDENAGSNKKISNRYYDNHVEGFLTDDTIRRNLSNLGRTADGSKLAYLNLLLPGQKLNNISTISQFRELETLDLSHNNIKDLSPLSELPFLLKLNVSNNEIEKLFDFLPPYNLKEANFSFNQIREIGNLCNFHYLQSLELNNNKIEKIEGLEYCQRLKHLNLGHNNIKRIEGLDKLPLTHLDLRSNKIKKINGLDTLKYLTTLILSGNMIKSLDGMPSKHEFLEYIDLEDNKINNIEQIDNLTSLNLLRNLNLLSNPLRELENYRLAVVFKLPKLTSLDRRKVDPAEKVNANNLFYPSSEYIASRLHIRNLIFNLVQDQKVKESTLPSLDTPYPILILCGPEGSATGDLSRKLAEEYPGYFDYVAPFTTRNKRAGEKDKYDFNFIKLQDFDQLTIEGKFLSSNEYYGEWFGLHWDSIESVAREGLACVTQMELEGLLAFKKTYFEPRCVLVLTLDKNVQTQRLKNIGCEANEIELAINRTDVYAEYNRDHPGFFDAVIITDDTNKGYENLRNLVMSYLGVSDQEAQNSVKHYATHNNLSTVNSSRPNTNEESKRKDIEKDFEIPRSDSFLPSNTATGNRSQMSHLSIESLAQAYSQNLKMKFGSAPAHLLTKGQHAEKSIEKRASKLRDQINQDNIVSTRSQMSQKISKQAFKGSNSISKMSKHKNAGVSVDLSNENESKKTKIISDNEEMSDDDQVIINGFNKSNQERGSSSSSSSSSNSGNESGRSSVSSSN